MMMLINKDLKIGGKSPENDNMKLFTAFKDTEDENNVILFIYLIHSYTKYTLIMKYK